MRVTRTVIVNIAVFLTVSALLIGLGVTQLLAQGGEGLRISAEFTDASGILPRNDVTLRGVTVGGVTEVVLTDDAVLVTMALDPGVEVPEGTTATAVRRSPIGDMIVELTPGDGEPMGAGGTIPVTDTSPAPDAGKTIEALADLLHSVPSEDLDTVVSEAALALEGRGRDLGRLSRYGADLPDRILEVQAQLESLIRTGPEVTGVLADNADVLADDITRTAQLADILRDRRYDLVDLYRNGARFTRVAGDLIAEEKPNIACLVRDFGMINQVLATGEHLTNLAAALDLNHYFFGGVDLIVQKGLDGRDWFRVQLLPHTEPPARQYQPQRDISDVYGADACRTRYGPGVRRATQEGELVLAPGSKFHPGE
jgi:phospholipid/cholesterol/gamma-HCH transport system substrate-binding protein